MIDLIVDFETFYDEKAKYSLKYLTAQQYINDPRFKVLGMSVATSRKAPAVWVDGDDKCRAFFDALKPQASRIRFIAHNASFDAAVAYRAYGFKPAEYCCTMFMARYLISQNILPSDIRTSLREIAPFVGSEKLHLDEALQSDTLDTYANRDTEICRDFYDKFVDRIPELELRYIDMHIKMSAIPNFALDKDALEKVATVDERRKALYPAVRQDEKLIEIFRKLGVEPEMKQMKLGMKPCFAKSDDFMKGLLSHKNPMVRFFAELRLEAKSTCAVSKAQRFLDCGDRMACPIIYMGAATGRSSGTDKMNVQNMPRGSAVRTSLMAMPGKKLVIIDSSQIEVRTLGFLAGDESILSVFRRGGDIYREFAGQHLYGKAPEEVTKDERQVAKAAVLALGFGQGVNGFIAYAARMGITLTEAEAAHAVAAYRNAYPKITGGLNRVGGLWQRLFEFVKQHGYSVLPNGRRLYYPNMRWENDDLFYDRHAIFSKGGVQKIKLWPGLTTEQCTQATARDLIFTQTARVLAKYPQVDLCLMVHDEAIFSVPEDIVDEVFAYTEQSFKTPPLWAKGMPLNGEGHISDRYDK